MCCNPCCFCTAEVGVYILSLIHSLFVTGALVFGVIQGFGAYWFISQKDEIIPKEMKALRVAFVITYFFYLIIEIGLREYLNKTLEMSPVQKLQRCRIWVKAKIILLLFGIPAIIIHIYLQYTHFKLALYICANTYQIYYIWVVFHYALEVEKDIEEINQKHNEKNHISTIEESTHHLQHMNSIGGHGHYI